MERGYFSLRATASFVDISSVRSHPRRSGHSKEHIHHLPRQTAVARRGTTQSRSYLAPALPAAATIHVAGDVSEIEYIVVPRPSDVVGRWICSLVCPERRGWLQTDNMATNDAVARTVRNWLRWPARAQTSQTSRCAQRRGSSPSRRFGALRGVPDTAKSIYITSRRRTVVSRRPARSRSYLAPAVPARAATAISARYERD